LHCCVVYITALRLKNDTFVTFKTTFAQKPHPLSLSMKHLLTLSSATVQRSLTEQYPLVRQWSEKLCQPLQVEDYVVQSMADVSPPKWHLAHTTWFFETFLLQPYLPKYQVFHPQYGFLFNSYYEALGSRHPRPQRGLITRPTVAEVYQYRAHVDAAMTELLHQIEKSEHSKAIADLITLGLHHEQQHQELLLTDLKHIFSCNPLRPAYRTDLPMDDSAIAIPSAHLEWLDYSGGLHVVGHNNDSFAFDNESPRHQVYLEDFYLAGRLVINGEYLEFIEAGGYQKPEYWLSEGWSTLQQEQWQAPLYWENIEGSWWNFTLGGMRPVNLHEPVCHVSFFEADAFARWAGRRLPTETEWEIAAALVPIQGNLLEADYLHPIPAMGATRPDQIFGDVWEWTQSAYLPYPGFQTAAGAVGEYNGKFMCNQMVLRGGSCVTPPHHIRPTYRNFFPAAARWQFSGIRLAKDSDR
jgi:ergothioneine biosynthesis protein EgtB